MARRTPIDASAVPLTDGVVVVRLRRPGDLDAVAAASHDPQTLRWLDDPAMDAETRATSMSRVDEAWRTGRATPLIIADAGTDDAVGTVNVQFRGDGVATVAYSVFPGHRGRGIAPRAVSLVVRWALRDLGLAELYLEADEANAASTGVAEKCRFDRVDTRREDGPDGEPRTVAVFRRSARPPQPPQATLDPAHS